MRPSAPKLNLHDLLGRAQPFAGMQMAHLAGLQLSKLTHHRSSFLLPEPGHLYFLLSGSARQIDQGHDKKRSFESACFEPGSVIGWWPIRTPTSCIEHQVETHYIAIAPGWETDETLQAFSQQVLLQRLESQHQQLVISMTSSKAQRLALIPRRMGESNTDWARRVGCTREYVSRTPF